MCNNKKMLSIAIDISQMLFNNQCSYDEAEEILQLMQHEIKQQRENYEYATIEDYINGVKTNFANDVVICPLHHLDGFC